MASPLARAVLALALLVACAGLRVLPHAPVRLLAPPVPSCAVAMAEANPIPANDENYMTTTEKRQSWQKNELEGVGPGGWDNDEYLEMTKAATPEPADTKTLLRQAYAYRDMIKEKNLPSRPDVEEMIAELEAGADPETLAAVQQQVADVPEWRPSQMRRPSDLPNSPPPPPSLEQLFGPVCGASPLTPTLTISPALTRVSTLQAGAPAQKEVKVTNAGGMSSSSSYAAMMAQAANPSPSPSPGPSPSPSPGPSPTPSPSPSPSPSPNLNPNPDNVGTGGRASGAAARAAAARAAAAAAGRRGAAAA